MTQGYYYCQECQNTVTFGHECVMDKITRTDMGKAYEAWLKEQSNAVDNKLEKLKSKIQLAETVYAMDYEDDARLVLPKESSQEVVSESTNSGNHISMKDAVYNRLTATECIDRLKKYGWEELRGSDGLTEAVNELFLGSRILVYRKES